MHKTIWKYYVKQSNVVKYGTRISKHMKCDEAATTIYLFKSLLYCSSDKSKAIHLMHNHNTNIPLLRVFWGKTSFYTEHPLWADDTWVKLIAAIGVVLDLSTMSVENRYFKREPYVNESCTTFLFCYHAI